VTTPGNGKVPWKADFSSTPTTEPVVGVFSDSTTTSVPIAKTAATRSHRIARETFTPNLRGSSAESKSMMEQSTSTINHTVPEGPALEGKGSPSNHVDKHSGEKKGNRDDVRDEQGTQCAIRAGVPSLDRTQ